MDTNWTINQNPEERFFFDIVWTEFLRESSSGNILLKSPYQSGQDFIHVSHNSLTANLGLNQEQSTLLDVLKQTDPFPVVIRPRKKAIALSRDCLSELPPAEIAPAKLEIEGEHPYKSKLSTRDLDKSNTKQTSKKSASSLAIDDKNDIRGNKNDIINGPM